jgi:hypothetical protein
VVQAGDQADLPIQQRSGHAAQVVGSYEGIAVGHDQHVVARVLEHIDEAADLAVMTVLLRVDHHLDRQARELLHHPGYHRERRVVGVTYAEDDLEFGIVLLAEGAQVLVQAGLGTTKGLEHRDGGEFDRGTRQLAPVPDQHRH